MLFWQPDEPLMNKLETATKNATLNELRQEHLPGFTVGFSSSGIWNLLFFLFVIKKLLSAWKLAASFDLQSLPWTSEELGAVVIGIDWLVCYSLYWRHYSPKVIKVGSPASPLPRDDPSMFITGRGEGACLLCILSNCCSWCNVRFWGWTNCVCWFICPDSKNLRSVTGWNRHIFPRAETALSYAITFSEWRALGCFITATNLESAFDNNPNLIFWHAWKPAL